MDNQKRIFLFERKEKSRIFAQFLYDGKWYSVYIVFI